MIKIVLSLARAVTRLSATTRRDVAVLALAMFSGLAVNATDYYLVGNMSDANWVINNKYKLQPTGVDGEYAIEVTFTEGTQFKFGTPDNTDPSKIGTYYPDGDNFYKPAGNYKIYFRPNYDGGDGWIYGGIYIKDNMDYYLLGINNDWGVNQNYKLKQHPDNVAVYYIDVVLTNGTEIKIGSSADDMNIVDYYPTGTGNNYKIWEGDGTYTVYFCPCGNNSGGNGWFNPVKLDEGINVSVTMADEGYGTYYNSKFDATLPAGVTAKIVTGENNGKLTYQTIAEGDGKSKSEDNTVPAGTAVMLQGTSCSLTLSLHDIINTYYGNLLHGSDEATTTTGGSSYYYYKLSYQEGSTDADKTIGWYWGADGGGVFTSGGHRAWLALPTTVAARAFFDLPDSDEKTGISATRIENNDNWYSIDGRRLTGKPSQRGVYINNGKKLIIK